MPHHVEPAADGSAPAVGLRVLFLIDSLGPGGAERTLVEASEKLRMRGIDVRVAALQDRDGNPVADELRALGIPVPVLDVPRLRSLPGYVRVRSEIARIMPDIVHTHLEFANVLGTFAAHRLGVPSVATLHTLDAPAPGSRAHARMLLAAHMLRRYASRVFVVSRAALEHCARSSRLPRDKLVVVNNGIELARFSCPERGTRAAVRRELGIAPDAKVIVTVAVLRAQKGIDCMIRAMCDVRRAHPQAVYVVAGDGPRRDELLAEVARQGLTPDVVRLLGHRADIERVLAAADLFVLPSLADALPTALIEAMAAGIPVVASAVDGILEMIDHGRTGVLVPPGDRAAFASATTALLAEAGTAEKLGRAARAEASLRFDSKHFAGTLEAHYREVVSLARRTA